MTHEQKQKLKQAAETAWEQDQKTNPSPVNPHAYVYGYKAGAQNILKNPSGWGLATQSELEFYKIRADHDPNSPFNKIANAVDKKLTQLLVEQKKDGKKFISDEEVDQLIDKIVREELGNDTGRS